MIQLFWEPISNKQRIIDWSDASGYFQMLDGALREVRFSWPEDSADSTISAGGDIREMQPIGESVLETNQVCYINGNFP